LNDYDTDILTWSELLDELLMKIAIMAWSKYPDRIARVGRRDYVHERLPKSSLTYELIHRFDPEAITQAIDHLLKKAEDKIKAEGQASGICSR
jgi:hypothetical protein